MNYELRRCIVAPPASHENRGEPRLSRKAGQAQQYFVRLWSQVKVASIM